MNTSPRGPVNSGLTKFKLYAFQKLNNKASDSVHTFLRTHAPSDLARCLISLDTLRAVRGVVARAHEVSKGGHND